MSQELHPVSKTNSKQKQLDPAGYLSNKTIAALCSPTGGAICILKISGSIAFEIAEKLTQNKSFQHRTAKRVWIYGQEGKKIDDAVLLPFHNPQSFTGENVVEFFLHGSPIVAQKVLDLTFAYGARASR